MGISGPWIGREADPRWFRGDAMQKTWVARVMMGLLVAGVVSMGVMALATATHAGGPKGCARGIRACDASRVGQPCDPKNPGVICSAEANGAYCCLAYAP